MGTVLDKCVGGEYCHQRSSSTSPPESPPQPKKITRTWVTLQLPASAFLIRPCSVNMVLSQLINTNTGWLYRLHRSIYTCTEIHNWYSLFPRFCCAHTLGYPRECQRNDEQFREMIMMMMMLMMTMMTMIFKKCFLFYKNRFFFHTISWLKFPLTLLLPVSPHILSHRDPLPYCSH